MFEPLSQECLSEWQMDRRLLGLESQAEEASASVHLSQCHRCQQEWAAMKQDREAFLASPPVFTPPLPKDLESPHLTSWTNGWRSLGWGFALAACCLLILLPPILRDRPYIGVKSTRSARLMVAIQHEERVHLATSGEWLSPGDHIRLAYLWNDPASAKGAYLFVLHRDPNNKWSALYPHDTNMTSLPAATNVRKVLPDSYEADETQHGFEEIWACFSRRPLSFREVRKEIPSTTLTTHWSSQTRGPCVHLERFVLLRQKPSKGRQP